MKKKFLSLFVICALLATYLAMQSQADSALLEADSVITAELSSVMATAGTTDKIPVSIWTTEVDTEVVEAIALEKTGLNREKIRELSANGETEQLAAEAVDAYIAAEREIYKRLQTQAHQTFVDSYAFLKTATAEENAYVCSYAPMMIVELTSAQIQTLADISMVEVLTYAPIIMLKEEMNDSLELIRAKEVRNGSDSVSPKTGAGIRIGQLEYGIPDKNKFPGKVIVTNTEGYCEVRTHATAVAEIMVSNSGNIGIAPNATLYCTGSANGSTEFYEGVEWLIGKNVNIINMSANLLITDWSSGQYTYIEEWVDHVAINHSVHFVKSAGNTDGNITVPGLAYNIITVGSFDNLNKSYIDPNQCLGEGSAFNEVVNSNGIMPTNKPELVAPGTSITTNSISSFSGTSAAAPHVTGVIAQLLEQYPALKTQQDTVKAILTASVRHDYCRYDSNDTTEFDIYGAGLIDAKSSSNTVVLGNFISSNFGAGESVNTKKTFTFNVTSQDQIKRVSLTWLKYNKFAPINPHIGNISDDPTNTIAPLANLDMVIIAPNGTRLTYNGASSDNLVIAEFDPDDYGTGTYTVEIYIRNTTTARTYFSICWW